MKHRLLIFLFSLTVLAGSLLIKGCADEDADAEDENSPGTTSENTSGNKSGEVPAVYKKIYGAEDIYVDGDYIVIKANSLPDHKSSYFEDTEWASTMYAAYDGDNPDYRKNPNKIFDTEVTYKIPLNPQKEEDPRGTPMGPIGVWINGVPVFNQYAGVDIPLTFEINSFDQYNGHPTGFDMYHYHIEPLYLTANHGKDALLGFLTDGFPVYGPEEGGKIITNADLDAYHGHTGVKPDYPDGIYHYHVTSEAPYINGDGFYGTPGTVTR